MNRSRLLLVSLFTITFALAATAFHDAGSAASRVGALTATAPMLEPRSGQSATLLPDGKVLIAGGMRRNQDFYKSAELYDPATGKFQSTGEMNMRRVGHIAVLLGSGKVLVAGGWGSGRYGFGRVVRSGQREVHAYRQNDNSTREAQRDTAGGRRCPNRGRGRT